MTELLDEKTLSRLTEDRMLARRTGGYAVKESSRVRPYIVRVFGVDDEPTDFQNRLEFRKFVAMLSWEFDSDAGFVERDLAALRHTLREMQYLLPRDATPEVLLPDNVVVVPVKAIYKTI